MVAVVNQGDVAGQREKKNGIHKILKWPDAQAGVAWISAGSG